MKIVLMFAVAIALLGACAISSRKGFAQSPTISNSTRQESPFYCIRNALTPEQLHRKEELGKTLHAQRKTIHELPDGYEFELPNDPSTVQSAAEWAAMERLCCPFFDIDLRLQCENGPFFLRLTGREGVKQFIKSEFTAWFQGGL